MGDAVKVVADALSAPREVDATGFAAPGGFVEVRTGISDGGALIRRPRNDRSESN